MRFLWLAPPLTDLRGPVFHTPVRASSSSSGIPLFPSKKPLNVVNRTGSDTFSLTYNNVYAPGWIGGLYSADLLPAVANSLSLNPGYVEAESGDMRYTNATLKTADSTGGAIGTDAIFTNIVPVELSAFGLM